MTKEGIDKKGKWGGARRGAGRKKADHRRDVPHRARPELVGWTAVHVVLRVLPGIGRLRQGPPYVAIREVLGLFLNGADFQITHVSIQSNHIHLIVEAASKRALSRGVQRLSIKLASALNAVIGRSDGKVFEHRYHSTVIATAQQARHTIAYVLNNWRKHREDLFNATTMTAALDPYASGITFDGWVGARRFTIPDYYTPLPVSAPRTSLLRSDWKRYGAIDLFECPGPLR